MADPVNPTGEVCAWCHRIAVGYARVDGVRYCHETTRDCYRLAQPRDLSRTDRWLRP